MFYLKSHFDFPSIFLKKNMKEGQGRKKNIKESFSSMNNNNNNNCALNMKDLM